jgi:fructose-1,6-bisphosphatase I
MGSLVGDFHRNLIDGGLYLYPADSGHPIGKLRLCCELNPLALIALQAGGAASNGTERILELKPQNIHQRSPVAIGSLAEVELYEQFIQGNYPPDFTGR